MMLALAIFFYAVGGLWLVALLRILGGGRTLKRLPAAEELPAPERAASVSVIVPARDEQARIETTVRNLFAQRGVALEVLVADDRSTDRTPEILAGLQGEFPHLKVIRIDALPEGWIGKCHAMHRAAERATGDWLLFTDGDVHLSPDTVARAVAAAVVSGADHLTLTPSQCPPGEGGAAGPAKHGVMYESMMTVFALLMASELGDANRDKPESMGGIGAFNLVRSGFYRRFGGHEPLRMTVVDDMKLGLLVRRNGGRTRTFIGGPDVQCDWAASVRGMFKALEKNMFAAMGFATWRIALGTLMAAAIYGGAIAALFFLPHPAAIVAAAGPALLSLVGLFVGVANGFSPLAGLLAPVAMWLILAAGWHSVLTTLRQGGIRWRETFYPLETLREGQYR